ncbi:hypothetical protein [Halobacteriovorax sp. HLS]|uniref:hypothetical protein n=1 Tax=Halobacteriovorax sp. HLS TaxID=2234000 RepID=UPI000FDB6F44|nr:hypothetical protein [Halobacteriovorax sp. HLS]
MKNLRKILTFLLLLTLTACMPDSLTKFKEAPTKKTQDTTSSGGSGDTGNIPPTSTCVPGTDPLCTSPGPISYPQNNYEFLMPGDVGDIETITAIFPSRIAEQEEYISVAVDDSDFSTKTGFLLDVITGDLLSSPSVFLPKTPFVFTATYSTTELLSDEVSSTTVTFTQATDLEKISIPTKVGQKLILELDDVSLFSSQTGFNYISTASGATGTISYIDTENKEVHVDIVLNGGAGTFEIDNEVDNSSAFFSPRTIVKKVYLAFDRSNAIQTALIPKVTGKSPLSTAEELSLTYSIFPSLPSGLSFDKSNGTIGTLRGYQILDDGTYTLVEGSRTVTGVGTLFLSQLQVGSAVLINGEFHEIESIASNTEFKTFSPLGSTTSVSSINKLIKGSLVLTNGSSVINGFGSDFATEIVPTKGLYVDAVGTFTGLVNTLVTVVDATTLNLPAAFAGTALTIPELKAATYTISAKNILNKSISKNIEFGLLDTVQPKTIGDIIYTSSVSDDLVVSMSATNSFSVGQYISNKYGTIARIKYIKGDDLFVTLNQLGSICTNPIYTTSGTCTASGASWVSISFNTGDEIDNSPSFFSSEATVAKNVTRLFPISSNTVTLTPTIVPTSLGAAELASLTYTISPDISSGQGFCSNTTYTNQFDCESNAGVWSQGLTFNTSTGVISGVISQEIAESTFTVTVENLVGRVTSSQIVIASNEAPSGLAISKNVLLHVPSNSAFEIGDAITSNNGALGTITGKFRINNSNAEKGTYEFEFLEVSVANGTFEPFDDLDNLPLFGAQKTYILGSGVYNYNVKVKVATNTDSFKDPEYTDYVKHQSLLQIGGVDRAHIKYNDEVNDTLYLVAFDSATYAANLEPQYLTTGNVLTAPNITGTPSATVSIIESNNIILNTDSAPTGLVSNFSKGHDITSTGDAGIGMLHKYISSGGNFYSYVSVTEGIFSTGADIQATSPFSASTATIGTVASEAAVYFYRQVPGTIELNLYNTDNETLIELDKALPAGLSATLESGSIVRISGTPTGPSDKEKFTLTATNPFGSTKYEFFIKVYDHINLIDKTNSVSYILHKTGKGNGRKPCSVTEEQMLYGDSAVKDISCFLDAGEEELHWNGVKLEFQMGENLCQFVEETPPAFWSFSPGSSSTELGITIYEHTGYASCTSGAPVDLYTTDAGGTTALSTVADPRILIPITEPKNLCMFNYDEQNDDTELPKCDIAEFPKRLIGWSATTFECRNSGSTATLDANAVDCVENNGTCAGHASAPAVMLTQTECVGDGGAWTFNGSHNDATAGGVNVPAVGACIAGSNLDQGTFDCGGETNKCLAGPRTSSTTISEQDVLDGVTTINHNMTGIPLKVSLPIDYTNNYDGSTIATNTWFSNYFTACGADAYKPDTISMQTSIDASTQTNSYLGLGARSMYQFVCKSGTGTIKARIRMIVRDFDRDFKVKFGYCANSSYTNKTDCEDPALGNTTWTASGIDYYNPDTVAGAPISTDPRHFLINSQLDGFGVGYNTYSNGQSYIGGGYTCGTVGNTINPTFPNGRPHPEQSL